MGSTVSFSRFDSARVLAISGLLFVAGGMVLGEIYAIYISHVANAIIGANWVGVIGASGRGDIAQLQDHFAVIGDLAAKRGRTMNSHSHLAAFGLLALVLALVQPYVDLPARTRFRLSIAFLAGSLLQVLGVYVSYYAGRSFLYASDVGALMLIGVVGVTLWGLRRSIAAGLPGRDLLASYLRPAASRYLVKSGLLLILLGMTFGLFYAWQLVSVDEPAVYAAAESAASRLAATDVAGAIDEITRFKQMQSRIAITAAAHSHAIEFGFLMLVLAFVQRYVMLSDIWRMRWARTVSVGAFLLPVCVYLATRFGLRAAAFSDLFGGVVLIGLSAMAFGMIRHTGAVDGQRR